MGPRIFFALLLLGGVVAGAIALREWYAPVSGGVPLVPAPEREIAAAVVRPTWLGSSSCAAAACHGQGGTQGSSGSEYDTWIGADPHAQAFAVLRNQRSQDMVRHLGLGPAHAETLCLRCHVHSGYDPKHLGPQFNPESGVSCESCHGAAQHWIDPHYRSEWQQQPLAAKRKLGLADTKTLGGRARTCIPCHVGAPDAEVNHDLIAAGHPVLRFEFGTYLANLPAHWDVKRDMRPAAREPAIDPRGWMDFHARAWLIGQAESARAALELVAERGRATGPWPEFAAFNCFACHHDLQEPSYRQQRAAAGAPGKVIPWQTWYLALVPRLVEAAEGPGAKFSQEFAALRTLMESRQGLRPSPPGGKLRTALGAQADQAAKRLEAWSQSIEKRRGVLSIQDLLDAVQAERAQADWDEAAQVYMAMAALRQAGPDPAALPRLQFPDKYDSPRDFVPGKK